MDIKNDNTVLVIGAGLAGSDCAWFLAEKGVKVILAESKGQKKGPHQKSPNFAELVCTNSLKSLRPESAHGLLKFEMRRLNSIILSQAMKNRVGAGDALAVDRELFGKAMTEKLKTHPNITILAQEVDNPLQFKEELKADYVVVATGPIPTPKLEGWLKEVSDTDLYFYDAMAPIVDADSLDLSKFYWKDRYKDSGVEGPGDYLNLGLTQEQYEHFVHELNRADKVEAKNFEDFRFFESCLPIDVMAERGVDTLRFSCMKPVGLEMDDGSTPYAAIQFRKENLLGQAFNMVGFQNRLTYSEQVRIFTQLPGMENAKFLHLGSVHRNTFLHGKKMLNADFSWKKDTGLFFAGQMTGVEGYTESAATGLFVAQNIWDRIQGKDFQPWPVESAIGALVNYVLTADNPSPSNINFGLFPPVEIQAKSRRGKKSIDPRVHKKLLVALRAHDQIEHFMSRDL